MTIKNENISTITLNNKFVYWKIPCKKGTRFEKIIRSFTQTIKLESNVYRTP